jgi:hypothetical protein
MSRFVDSIIAYRILNLLVTPFNKTEAFRLGIIDAKGKELKKMRDLNTVQLRDAYTLLHRLVFRLKKIIEKVPIENKKLVSLAAAYSLIREYAEKKEEPISLEKEYINKLNTDLYEEVLYVEKFLKEEKMKTFRHFSEDMGAAAVSAVPVNNAGSPGIAGLPPDDPPVSKKAQKKYTRKNNMFRR